MAKLKNIDRETFAAAWARLDIPLVKIAGALGVSRQAVSAKAKTYGLPSRQWNREPQKFMPDDLFRRMWMAGVCTSDIARAAGYSGPTCISKRRSAMGLPARRRDGGGRAQGTGIGGWTGTISIETFQEMELARMLSEV